MILLVAGVGCFILAFAAWRWGLGSRNWLEGTIVALVAAVLVVSVLHIAQRGGSRLSHPRRSNPTLSRPAGSDIR